MPLGNRKKNKLEDSDSKTIEINAEMKGALSFTDPVNLKINGLFHGELTAKGTLTIGENAQVNANIKGENIVIAGKVKGDIQAQKMLVLMPNAQLFGNISCPKINIVEGAMFQGFCQMREGLLDIDEVAKYLEIDIDEIQQMANSGKIPGTRAGDTWKFERDKIDDWAASAKLK